MAALSKPRHLILVRRAAKPFRHLGSAVMRGDQLAQIVAPHLAGRVDIRVVPFHAGLVTPAAIRAFAGLLPREAVVIFVKTAAKGLKPEHLGPLRRRGATIGFDVIDTPLDEIDLGLFDFHIAASITGASALRAKLAASGRGGVPVELLHHHADPRLGMLDELPRRVFRCGYLGRPENAAIPPTLADAIEIMPADHSRQVKRVLPRLGGFTLHFAVRPDIAKVGGEAHAYKPFTKGITAAACRANILVNRQAHDAEALLGCDYPFLVDSSDPAKVIAGYELAREAHGGPLWAEALERMRALAALVDPRALAMRLGEIVASAGA